MPGARLPALPTTWARDVMAGQDKLLDAAKIRAEGQAARGRGIAQGIAIATTGILRKHEESRADVRYAVQDENTRADNARADDALQFQKDHSISDILSKRIAGYDTEMQAAMPDPATGVGDPKAVQDVMAKRQKDTDTLTAILSRMEGSRYHPANQQASGGATPLSTGMTANMSDEQAAAMLPASTWSNGEKFCPT